MAKHKAPTEVAIAPIEEKSGFELWVQRYWKLGVALAIVISVLVIFQAVREQQSTSALEADWQTVRDEVDLDELLGLGDSPAPEVLQGLSQRLDGTDAGIWMRLLEVRSHLDDEDFDGARTALETLRAASDRHPLLASPFAIPSGSGDIGTWTTLVARLDQVIDQREAWSRSHPDLLGFPELPADAPRVEITTSAGKVVIGLYPDRAPLHSANFVERCSSGALDDTLFYRVIEDSWVEAGDPNTREDDRSQWGLGTDDDSGIEREQTNLWHFEGAVAANKRDSENRSSRQLFYITTADVHRNDKQFTVFGRVVEGMEVVRAIAEGELDENQHPLEPVEILSTLIRES